MNGKGGTGKTTISSLIMAHLVTEHKGAILAIDADPNSCLADALGIRDPQTIVGICDDISKNMNKIPAGMTKERFIEMRVQEALTEAKGFDLLVMGRPEGPGCYCYVNNLLRGVIGSLTKNYDFIVIDNAAGMEHISRRTVGTVNKLLLVSDFSVPGIRSTKKIYELAKELGIKIGCAYLLINKSTGPIYPLGEEIKATGLKLIGDVPNNEKLAMWSIENRPIFEFEDKEINNRMEKICEILMKG